MSRTFSGNQSFSMMLTELSCGLVSPPMCLYGAVRESAFFFFFLKLIYRRSDTFDLSGFPRSLFCCT